MERTRGHVRSHLGTARDHPGRGPCGRRVGVCCVEGRANAYGVSPQMRERVTAAIESLGYRPNAGARSMRGRSYTIGVVVTEFGTPFQLEVAQAIADELEPTPFHVVVVAGGDTPERQKPQIEGLIDRQVDGLILVAPWLDAGSIERIGQGLPIVTIALHGTPQHFDTVVDDEGLGARLVVDHLVALGHRRIVHTSQASGDWERDFILSHTARRLGFHQAMRRHHLEPDIIESYYSEEGGYAAAEQAFSRDPRPTAIFAGADIAALGVLRAAESMASESRRI